MSNDDLKDIKEQLKILDGRLDSVDKTLIGQHESLKLHIYRTDLAEKRLEHIENNLEPIKIHVNKINGVLAFLGILSTILAVIGGILKILGLF